MDYALIIGINDYTPPTQYGLRTLKGAINDANKVEDWITNPKGGNVPVANIRKILSKPSPLQPLQDAIDDAFLTIQQSVQAGGGKARRLYFYFAGHGLGTLDSTIDTAFCLANWSENRRQSALSSESYKDSIKQYGYFEEIIFIADCCRNTKINIKPKSPTFSAAVPAATAGMTKIFVAYATQYQDQSYEIETKADEMRGAFTTALIEGLNGAAANNGNIGVDDLRDYLIKSTPEQAKKQGYKQIPEITHNYPANATLVSVEITMTTVNIILGSDRHQPVDVIDGNLNVIQTLDPAQNKNYTLKLSKGLYLLKDRVTNESMPLQVSPSQLTLDATF